MVLVRKDKYKDSDVPPIWYCAGIQGILVQRTPRGWISWDPDRLGCSPVVFAPKSLSIGEMKIALEDSWKDPRY